MNKKVKTFFRSVWDKMTQGYDAGDSTRIRKDLGWGRQAPRDEDSMLSDNTLTLIRQKGIDLYRNNPIVSGLCKRFSLFTVGSTGILPQAKTSDPGWNRAAEQWWKEYSTRCDSRQRQSLYDFQSMAVSLRPVVGGMFFQKLADGTLRPIEGERIQQPVDVEKAKSYTNGVRIDRQTGRIKAYRVHARDEQGGFTGKHDEQDVPAENMISVTTPPWRVDQIREIPDLAPIIPVLQDMHELNTYTLNTAKWQSTMLAFLKKQQGGGLNAFPRNSSTTSTTARQTFKFDWGQVLEGLPGDDLEMKASLIPNATHIPYAKMQYTLCAAALNVPYEFLTLDLSGLDFSRQKGAFLLINFACRPWKRWLIDSFLNPLWTWRIAKEMGPGGQLGPAPAPKGISEWAQVDWQCPEEPWIDRQEAQQSDVLEIQSGLSTLGRASKRRGNDLEETLREKAREQKLIEQIAQEEGVDPAKLVFMQIPGQVEPANKNNNKDVSNE